MCKHRHHPPFALFVLLLIPFGLSHMRDKTPSDTPDAETMIDRRFDVKPGDALRVEVGDADLVVEPSDGASAHVEVILEARDMNKARRFFEKQHFNVEQQGGNVVVTSDPEENAWRVVANDWRDHPRILVHVRVPESFDADLRTSDGDVRLGSMRGEIRAHTSDGDLEVAELTGNVELKTSDGNITTGQLRGEQIQVQTSDGDIVLDGVRATTLLVRTSDGDLRGGQLEGSIELRTSDGDIHVEAVHGADCRIQTSDGDISIDELIATSCQVKTSDGSIALEHVESDLDAATSDGSVRVHLYKPGRVSLRATDGDIDIVAPEDLPAELYLRGVHVRVASTFDFVGHLDDERAEGRLGAGGPRIEAQTSEGTVTLRPR